MGIKIVVQPRIQVERWSLYWKQSMSTTTQSLQAITLEVDENLTLDSVLKKIGEILGWQSVNTLIRLEGFKEPWERVIYSGRELSLQNAVNQVGISDGSVLTVIRKELVAEGWRIEGDISDDEEQLESFQQFQLVA
eukprot:TRINITY_DN38466_c0_g1_i2.p1 TRINITY_DN38466_c0_g1~~TRINITY_DN38466_c0_g1_i2.p1  ORF type:complete len:136 (-),score=14.92 TRINITY_DN38466_c0_g1_i2:302-709(-)